MVEYALILVLVALAVITALTLLGTQISGVFSHINQTLQGR
ncbi:MAG: Flp family type IVb pilin [Candidatus Dormibacteraeota bacterium]|nr:Flp family type IVb pilin [Candidatus Dormibacteraeota bacterium]MBO0745516.1 Flp family type IVb pilin [Candidatus Dormibacteraeota bacterium]